MSKPEYATPLEALAAHLEVSPDEIDNEGAGVYSHGRQEWLALTDSEADAWCEDRIAQDLWAFRPEFLEAHTVKGMTAKAIAAIQESLYEDASDSLRALIPDWAHFVRDVMMADGRGHFLSSYDGEEIEAGRFYLYRVN